jgi:hypothetical protein
MVDFEYAKDNVGGSRHHRPIHLRRRRRREHHPQLLHGVHTSDRRHMPACSRKSPTRRIQKIQN